MLQAPSLFTNIKHYPCDYLCEETFILANTTLISLIWLYQEQSQVIVLPFCFSRSSYSLQLSDHWLFDTDHNVLWLLWLMRFQSHHRDLIHISVHISDFTTLAPSDTLSIFQASAKCKYVRASSLCAKKKVLPCGGQTYAIHVDWWQHVGGGNMEARMSNEDD